MRHLHQQIAARVAVSPADSYPSPKYQAIGEISDWMHVPRLDMHILRRPQLRALEKPKIDDWRAMVDCVMSDAAYDWKVFSHQSVVSVSVSPTAAWSRSPRIADSCV